MKVFCAFLPIFEWAWLAHILLPIKAIASIDLTRLPEGPQSSAIAILKALNEPNTLIYVSELYLCYNFDGDRFFH